MGILHSEELRDRWTTEDGERRLGLVRQAAKEPRTDWDRHLEDFPAPMR